MVAARLLAVAAAGGCPLRARCTTNKHGRALILHQHDALLRSPGHNGLPPRPCARTTSGTGRMSSAPSPRSPAGGGRRLKLRYRGTARNNAWLKRRTAALDLRNLISRGLAFDNGAWVLA
jgi:hypothetical protein